jgi:hypothetical protein
MKSSHILLAFVLVLFAHSTCRCQPTAPADQSTKITRPGVGSMFVYRRTYFDTLGSVFENRLDTEVVYQSGITYEGKNNVVAMGPIHANSQRFWGYYNYEANGDLDDFSDVPRVRHGWRTYPIASKVTSSWVQVDSVYTDGESGREINWFRQFVNSYQTEDTILEAGQKIYAIDILARAGNHERFQNVTTDFWIAPSLGVEVRRIAIISPPYPQQYSGWEFHLVSYTIK